MIEEKVLKRLYRFSSTLLAVSLVVGLLVALWPVATFAQPSQISADAVVLVNSTSAHYADFQQYVQPYLDTFGIPYTIHDIATEPLTPEAVDHALIIIGHNGLDETGAHLDSGEQSHISAAVFAGAGLVNFDRLLTGPDYQYVRDTLDLTLGSDVSAGSIEIGEGGAGIRINCWEDDHQDPVLAPTSNVGDLDETDGEWTEFDYSSRPFPSVMAGVDEETLVPPLPVMRFYASGIPDGEYEIFANLYTSSAGRDARYFYGYTAADPKAHWVDTVGGAGGSDQHAEYSLGNITITGGTFEIYVRDADLTGSNDYPFFGWAWIRLAPVGAPPSPLHYITQRHQPDETIGLSGSMTALGMTPPIDVEVVATAGSSPFIAVRNYGQGKAVQWGSYDWMSHAVKGPVYGLDDLVWRSLVWAARKPFVMQGMPPLLPFRIDDCSGPFWWAEDAAAHGLKPWIGFFLHNISDTEADQMKALIDAGDATASIHAFNGGFFYYNHSGADWPDAVIAAHYAEGTQWHTDHEIPISKYVLGHYYELGTNAFSGLSDWGVEFVGTHMQPGTGYGAPWLTLGPYRLYEPPLSSRWGGPVYYADYLPVPGHPEFDGQFFNVVTEIRDNAGYEWYPSNNVALSIERGVIQTRRAFDSMVLATLFTHEQHIQGITPANWNAILDGVLAGVAAYEPIYVTMDEAAQYVRAVHNSDIAQSNFDPGAGLLTTELTGETDMDTQFYLFTDCGSEILEQRVDVPAFTGLTDVVTQLPGALDRIEINPAATTLGFGDQQQFVAQGYDANDEPVVCASYTWDVINGGGAIDQDGLFTAGATPGTFLDTVTASDQGVTGSASVVVAETPVDHFAFDPIGDQVAGQLFAITITALDAGGLPVTSYDGTATLADTTGAIAPTLAGPFVNGVWSGDVTIDLAATDVVITAQDVAVAGSSNPFAVTEPPPIPAYLVTSASYVQTAGDPFIVTVSNIETTIDLWEDEHQDPVLTTFTNAGLLNDHDGLWDEFWYTSGRPFPTILAGHNEWENNGLQPMHFFAADLPNGRYQVWADLYTGRHTRHYYGLTEAEALAESRWVDNVAGAGGSDQHDEYSLGIIEITDNRFDLWAGNGDVLSGSPYFYGWAHVRLAPALPETTINLWEDDHQAPVLTTFTNPSLLDDHDGLWDEFLYTPIRPYPSILAGHNEWESNGLQPIHFFADGLADGIYEVWGNLYTVRATRYYYGFTEAEVLAETRWVEVAADTSGEQHTEYRLGTVEITGGRFDLWAGDGDLLAGSAYFYGWAHLRLVASGMTMTSNSPTMQFDGNGNGTFGEPGDDVGILVGGTFDIAARDTTAGEDVSITATDVAGYWGRATYTIQPGDLAGVQVEPATVELPPNGQQQFTATGVDQWGNPIEGPSFTWQVVNGGGAIDAGGLFTAITTPGDYADTVVASTGGFSGSATVTIQLIPANYFEFEFIYEPQYAGVPIEVVISALDDSGNPVTDYNGLPALSDTSGSIDPTTVGPFTAGVWQGYVTINTVADDVVITADDGAATGDSNPFDVLAAPEHIYAVTSDSYTQLVGQPFDVTVTPIDHTIDLWEDANQRPVLVTTENSGDLVATDGQWTEFHYVSGGRPFPSVFAGADEEDYGLPTMHFYAVGIPNGAYQVIADLYTSGSGRDMRYFYGFTPDDPKALYVDTVGGAGGADQHEEYSLGQITIDNGRFDLYVRDADLLGGSYPFFGWAHVRLEPAFPQTRINLWEDEHQDPDLVTTDVVADLVPDDDLWTEFLYTSRGYPAVFAGYDESPPLMRFHAEGIPNGEYTLIANLYWSHSLRYFWGYTAADPEAHFYDVTSGNYGDFAEYVIDQSVTVTDNTFELYVNNADPLPGGDYPFYGWAWVRLVPTHVTMSSSSATMLFDGNGNSIFGELGDDVHLMTGDPFTTQALDTVAGDNVLITATDNQGGTGAASYTILEIDHITVTPADATLDPGATQQFTAQAYDSLGNPVPGLTYAWSVVNGGGTIDQNGLFTAGTAAGVYADTVVAGFAVLQGTASVTVNSGAPVELAWEPVYGPKYATVPFLADLSALDQHGNVATSYNGAVNLSDSTASLTPGSVVLVNGQWTGELQIDTVANDVTVSADDGTLSSSTNAFDVLPAPEQSYDVSSDSYLQTTNVPFDITVSALASTINLWENNHQRPVLDTFTDPALFVDTDGAWDEFDWVNRPYPGVFGGIAETASGLLEPMHFYGVVPNGAYRVVANLYRSNDYRYFFGFEPADMRAHSVDVTSGPIGDFAEFDLGTITITDYRFNLYTDYAQVLVDRGSFPYFGWAWIRLEPIFEEFQINCWEDEHQDPDLVTTPNTGDLIADDGQWTEFHYTSRDYPSVMAGADEVDQGLPVMRFHAEGLPNGTYELIANLYTAGAGRDMRYYYGFAPDDYLAHYVDTVGGSGGANQHTEYSLGLVQITDGTFNIHVRDADLLAGTYPFFGWAWLRLAPAGLTMTSSSPTMLFDGNGNGTFGEPGDDLCLLAGDTCATAALDETAGIGVAITATDNTGLWGRANYDIDVPTAVTLVSFTATARTGAVLLEWETGSELDNLGFNLYRSNAADGPYVKLNGDLIPSLEPGSPVSSLYTWLDDDVELGSTHYYKLEAVDTSGNITSYGPVWVTVSAFRFYLPLVDK